MEKYLWIYLILINLIAFGVCAYDKRAAQRKAWRISEKTLFTLAIIGGSIGMLAGMKLTRHKTKKPEFYIGIPAIIIIQLVAVWFFFLR